MIRIKPSTPDADRAILESLGYGPKVYKRELVTHAAREILARHNGFASWDAMREARQAASEKFMDDLCAGKFDEPKREGVPGWISEYVSGKI